MKRSYSLILLLVCLVFPGCNKAGSSGLSGGGPVTRADGVANITITANDLMRYSISSFSLHSGEKVRLTLKNIGIMPLASMGHDLVILKQGNDFKKFASEVDAQDASNPSHVLPADLVAQTIAHTRVLGPGEEQTIEFTAPAPGVYQYLCTFPTHFVFMHGVITVK